MRDVVNVVVVKKGRLPTWLVAVKASGAGGIIFADRKTGRNRFRPSCLRRGAKQAPTSFGIRRWSSSTRTVAVPECGYESGIRKRVRLPRRLSASDRILIANSKNEANFRRGALAP